MLSHVRLFAILWTLAHQAPLSMGFPRQEYWSRLPFPIQFTGMEKYLLISPIQSADPKTVSSRANVVSSRKSSGGTLVLILGHLFCFLGSDRNMLVLPTALPCPSPQRNSFLLLYSRASGRTWGNTGHSLP